MGTISRRRAAILALLASLAAHALLVVGLWFAPAPELPRGTPVEAVRLPAGTPFQVIAYNRRAQPLLPRAPLPPADADAVAQARHALDALDPVGGTDYREALSRGLRLKPDVLYLLTDAADLKLAEID